ncbi:hypothetical protein B296_00014322 [Ensete ventricosum]|uniref:Uncharacterized protein n=1 Tax=Ensete ventricosum TaxID=4639 RepID=A0A427B2X1_ENSVE|nr:hypothetical protein B296_00014322 [Ensete ventricosum]
MLSISCNFAFCCTLCSAGFYICWGCLVWVPSIYTSPGMYLVNHPVNLGTQVNNFIELLDCVFNGSFALQLALFILVSGLLCIYINYDCDRQRQEFRRTNGKCLIWGKAPSKVLTSSRTILSGNRTVYIQKMLAYVSEILNTLTLTDSSLLSYRERGDKDQPSPDFWMFMFWLGNWSVFRINFTNFEVLGRWGVSRHFHYVPEILAAFFWSVFLQQLFVLMITTMYCYRYGKYWKMYCNKVPYRVIPGIH